MISKLCTNANVVTKMKRRYLLKNTWKTIITNLNTLVNFVSYMRTSYWIEKHITTDYYTTQYPCERCDLYENILMHWT